MSRITGSEAKSLMEAYSAVYAPQELTEEQIWEEVEAWVNSLVEEGYDLSEYTWEDMYEAYLNEMGQRMTTGQSTAVAWKPTPGAGSAGGSGSGGMRGSGRDRNASQTSSSPGALRVSPSATQRPAAPAAPVAQRPAAPAAQRPAAPAGGPKTAPTGSPPSSKPSGSPMDQWRKANPKLAAAADEKARIRGTSQTDNPLMKDMRSRMSMTPSVQSPTLAKDLGKGGGNQSLLNNPNAAKAAPPKPATPVVTPAKAISSAPSTSAAASGSLTPATAKIAAAPKPITPNPSGGAKKPWMESVDAYDLVLEYLLENGHAQTVDEAHYLMIEMNAEMIGNIVEGAYEDRIAANNKAYDRARKRAAQRAQARNDARDRGQTGSVPGVGYVTPRRERTTYTDAAGTERHHSGAKAK